MAITASALRQNVYRLLDQVIETGVPLEISRKGVVLKITSSKNMNKLENLKKRKVFKGNPEELVHIDWSSEWKQELL
jgi:hypothetical protein